MNTKTKSAAVAFLDKIIGSEMTVASELRAHRANENMTQAEMAKLLKISRVHFAQLEKGTKFLGPERAAAFAKKLGYSQRVFVELSLQDQLNRAKIPYRIKLVAA